MTLPKNEVELIEKSNTSSREQIQICLCYDNIRNILNGEYPDYPEYISMLIEQIDIDSLIKAMDEQKRLKLQMFIFAIFFAIIASKSFSICS